MLHIRHTSKLSIRKEGIGKSYLLCPLKEVRLIYVIHVVYRGSFTLCFGKYVIVSDT